MRPGDLAEKIKQQKLDIEALGQAKATVERLREIAKKDDADGFLGDARDLRELARDLEADVVNVEREMREPTNAKSLELALYSLKFHADEAFIALRELGSEPRPSIQA